MPPQLKIEYVMRQKVNTPSSETIQVLELGSGYKILTINTTFYGEFFLFSKQTAATEPPLCHGVA